MSKNFILLQKVMREPAFSKAEEQFVKNLLVSGARSDG